MAVNWRFMKVLDEQGLIQPGKRILDIGSSNLYSAPAEGIRALIAKYNPALSIAEIESLSQKLAAGSYVDPIKGATNEAWVGELFEALGMEYLAFDIAKMYKTEILDFNHHHLPAHHKGKFDLVLNFGTTEHVLHQFNSFKIIHEATAHSGTIWHQLPANGYVAHCYFSYHPRFFFDLAGYNGYSVLNYWYSVGGSSKRFDTVGDYSSHFPALTTFLEHPEMRPEPAENAVLEDACINIIYRKIHDIPFQGALEPSTAAGEISNEIRESYAHKPAAPIAPPAIIRRPRLVRAIRKALKPFVKPILNRYRGRVAS